MKRNLKWIGILIVVFLGAWFLAFGPNTPCGAMQREARLVAVTEGGEIGDAITRTLVSKVPDDFSTYQCTTLAIQLKIRGKDAVTLLTVRKKAQ